MWKSIIVKAKQNDAVIQLVTKDIFIDEIMVKIEGETSWTIIGFKDLQNAIAKAEKKFNPKGLKICPKCGRKHNETAYNVFCCDGCWNGY
jgi:hypothetical protein